MNKYKSNRKKIRILFVILLAITTTCWYLYKNNYFQNKNFCKFASKKYAEFEFHPNEDCQCRGYGDGHSQGSWICKGNGEKIPPEVQSRYWLTNDCNFFITSAIPKLNNSIEMTCESTSISNYSGMNIIALDRFNDSNNGSYYRLRIFQIINNKDLKSLEKPSDLKLVYEERMPSENQRYTNSKQVKIVNLKLDDPHNPYGKLLILTFNSRGITEVGVPSRDPQGYSIKWKL